MKGKFVLIKTKYINRCLDNHSDSNKVKLMKTKATTTFNDFNFWMGIDFLAEIKLIML